MFAQLSINDETLHMTSSAAPHLAVLIPALEVHVHQIPLQSYPHVICLRIWRTAREAPHMYCLHSQLRQWVVSNQPR